ncbi:MAG: hypothetical protein ABI977_08690 [Acidobacteriota bacterium]
MKRSTLFARSLAVLAVVAFMLSKELAVLALALSQAVTAPAIPNPTSTTAAEEAYFVMEVPPRKDNFVVKLTDPAGIQKARDLVSGRDQSATQITGIIVKQPACYNPPWSFHFEPDSIGFFDSAIEVCDASIAYTESFLSDAGGAFLPDNRWCQWGSRLLREIPPPTCDNGATSVSAASFKRVGVASQSIITAFGSGLATATESATTLPLPTTLAGTTVKIKDGAGKETLAPLFFVSPTQVNYQVPAGLEPGLSTVTITNAQGQIAKEYTQVLTIAPGLFTANASGQGVVAAVALRIKADGSQQYESVARLDQTLNRFVPAPIDLGAATDQVFLVIFGTGLRGAKLEDVDAKMGEFKTEAVFIGPQPDFTGLDQINLRLPRRLAGQGEVTIDLLIDDQKANSVIVAIK